MEMILDMANKNVQEALKEFKDNKNKEYEKTQKQINEITGALVKQNETENTISTEISELRLKTDNIKEEEAYDMENLRKKERNRNTKQNGRPLQQTRTSRRQNLRT
jgi:predicted nuclease with TOPRIM domain